MAVFDLELVISFSCQFSEEINKHRIFIRYTLKFNLFNKNVLRQFMN